MTYMVLHIEHEIEELRGVCYSIYGVADMLGISYDQVRKLDKKGKIKSFYSSKDRRYWIPNGYFYEFLKNNLEYYHTYNKREIEKMELRRNGEICL